MIDTSRSMLGADEPAARRSATRGRPRRRCASARPSRTCRSGSPRSPTACCRTSSRARTTTSSSRRSTARSASTGRRRTGAFVSTATRLAALETIVSRRFFTPTVAQPADLRDHRRRERARSPVRKIAAAFRRPPGVDTIFLHVWDGDERVFDGNQPEPQYSPDPRSRGDPRRAPPTRSAAASSPRASSTRAIAAARDALGDGHDGRAGARSGTGSRSRPTSRGARLPPARAPALAPRPLAWTPDQPSSGSRPASWNQGSTASG